MTDTPLPDPLDEQASDLLDAGTDAPSSDGALVARVDELRSLRAALADVPPPDPARRDQAIAAALAAFDTAAFDTGAVDTAASGAPAVVAPVTPLAPRVTRGNRPARRWLAALGAAAAVVVVLGAVRLFSSTSSEQRQSSGALAKNGNSFDAPAGGGATTAAGATSAAPSDRSATAVAGDASTAGAGATTTAAAASGAFGTTTAAAGGAPTTAAAAASTASPVSPSTKATALLPYLGDLSRADEVTAALAVATATDTDAAGPGRDERQQVAQGVCDLPSGSAPLAVLRWNGRSAVVARSTDGTLAVVVLDTCTVVARPDAPG